MQLIKPASDSSSADGSPPRGSSKSDSGNGHQDGEPESMNGSSPASNAAQKALERLHLEPGEAVSLDKNIVARGTILDGDQTCEVLTNVYGIRSKPVTIYHYHCDFYKVFENGSKADQLIPLVLDVDGKRKAPDFYVREHRELHRTIMNKFIEKFPDVFGDDVELFCYDYSATLFSLVNINVPEEAIELTTDETMALIGRAYRVLLVIKQPKENEFNVRDFVASYGSDLSEANTSVTRFLELATSRQAAEHPDEHVMFESKKTNFMNPENHGFRTHALDNAKYLCPAASKNVVCLEGPREKGVAALIIDSKNTPFYYPKNCVELVLQELGTSHQFTQRHWNTLMPLFKGNNCLVVLQMHRDEIPIVISKLHTHNAFEQTFKTDDGNDLSVYQYFQLKYQKTLRYPDWPLVLCKVRGKVLYYPIEVLQIADNQRCKVLSSENIAVIVKACAVPPTEKAQEIQRCHGAFNFQNDGFCKSAKLEVMSDAVSVQARVLSSPQISYLNGIVKPFDGRWKPVRHHRYVLPASCNAWVAILLRNGGRQTRMHLEKYFEFVKRFVQECMDRGMQIENLMGVWEVNTDNGHELENVFTDARDHQVNFILIGHPDEENVLHPIIKGYERKYGVITQCIKTQTILKVLTKGPLILENIVAKTNVKLGGLNYNISLPNYKIDDRVCFIGLGMNHPAGGFGGNLNGIGAGGNVSVLGFAANDGKNPNEFIGNFFYQPLFSDEKITVLDKLLDEIFERFKKNRGYHPTRVIFYRNGCSEGQFGDIVRYEIPIISTIIGKHAPGAPFSVIIPSKMHSTRFFKNNINPRDRASDQNIRPGTVIDTTVVHHKYSEFYLNAHLAIQGTAKTPKYTVIHTSEKDATLDMFERWTNALCYDFQIVTSPTSLPAPVFIANRYAERGRQLYNVNEGSSNGNDDESNGTNGKGSELGSTDGQSGSLYYDRSIKSNFTNVKFLRDKRINA